MLEKLKKMEWVSIAFLIFGGKKVRKQVESDGYVFDENGYATKIEIVEEIPREEVIE